MSGCASSQAGAHDGGGRTSTGPTTRGTVRLSAADNGHRITVPTGATVVVALTNTYWRMAPVSSPALQAGKVAVHSRKSRIPGTGSGTVVATYRAVASGRAVVAANRTTCGEALRCSPAQSRYRVTVVVR